MMELLNSLQPRERRTVIGGGVALLLMMIYFFGWEPLVNDVEQMQQNVSSRQVLKQWMQGAAQEVKQLKRSSTKHPQSASGQSLLALVDRTARRSRLGAALKRVEPEGRNGVRVWLEQASFDDMMRWLRELQRQYAITAKSITVDGQAVAGRVDVRMTLQKPDR